jgi:superfamily I DNA/RNA helicase
VAVTRARNELYLAYPLLRSGYGNAGPTMQQQSRFLHEIPDALVEEWSLRTFR